MKRLRIMSTILITMLLSVLACSVGGDAVDRAPTSAPTKPSPTGTPMPTPPPPPTPLPTETRAPTATLTSQPTQAPTETAQPTLEPTPEGLALQGPVVAHNGIAFEFASNLGDTVYASSPSEYVDGYTRFAFAPAGYCREIGCVEVFEVKAYEDAFPGRPLPPVGAATILRAQSQPLEFQGGSGTRSVKMYGQDIYWANNDAIVYEYRGLTEDGQYYVLVTFPLDAPILLSSFDPEQNTNEGALPVPFPLPTDPVERDTAIREYNQEVERQLDLLVAEDFVPDLGLLDALVNSIRIEALSS